MAARDAQFPCVKANWDECAYAHHLRFDEILGRVQARGIPYTADPNPSRPQQINTNHGGRGFYFHDPAGHGLEVLTRPYGALEAG